MLQFQIHVHECQAFVNSGKWIDVHVYVCVESTRNERDTAKLAYGYRRTCVCVCVRIQYDMTCMLVLKCSHCMVFAGIQMTLCDVCSLVLVVAAALQPLNRYTVAVAAARVRRILAYFTLSRTDFHFISFLSFFAHNDRLCLFHSFLLEEMKVHFVVICALHISFAQLRMSECECWPYVDSCMHIFQCYCDIAKSIYRYT